MQYTDKKALVCGMAKSGIASARLLNKLGAKVILQDIKTKDSIGEIADTLEKEGISLYLGKNPDDIIEEIDMIVLSPGVPYDLEFLVKAREMGKETIGEIELSSRFCACPIIGITGTNGKTTTTSLVGEVLKKHNSGARVVGNIGFPFADEVLELKKEDYAVAELSSFQLESVSSLRPKISAVLNITPDHLNRHYTVDNYAKAKERIFEFQGEEDFAILNFEDSYCRDMAQRAKAGVVYFSSERKLDKGVYSDEKSIYINIGEHKDEIVVDIDDMNILGKHNVENAMAAVAILFCAGVSLDTIREGLKSFKGVEHRIEYVREYNGIEFFNDSKGTNPDAAIRAVLAMKRPICLIGGGYDKGSEFDEWVKEFKGRVKFLAIIGAVSEQLKDCCDRLGFESYKLFNSFEEAIEGCMQNAESGDCVLLSPACASWDMFDSYEQRGDIFKEIVNKY